MRMITDPGDYPRCSFTDGYRQLAAVTVECEGQSPYTDTVPVDIGPGDYAPTSELTDSLS